MSKQTNTKAARALNCRVCLPVTDPRDQFEPQYALAHDLDPLQVKFERAATGAYRDPAITRAFREQLSTRAQWRAA